MAYVIVGAGLAGAKAAEKLRAEGYDGRLVLFGDERDRPYERPPLSKGYLLGDQERAEVFVHEESWYADHDVELRVGTRVTGLDLAAHEVAAGGERLGYTKLLLATGSSPRRLKVDGGDLDGVHYLRRLSHADALRDALAGAERVVVAGAGWIGLEIASAARGKGCAVTVVEPAPSPLHAALGPELGGFFADLHRERGVDFRFGAGVERFRGAGRVEEVVTTGGDALPADLVVVGVGARPNTELAEAAGLAVDDGVVVDAALRTADPDVYAAGDIAAVPSSRYGRRVRVEHWANAVGGGEAAARAMLGQEVAYDDLPYFFSDQYDVGMEFAGLPDGYDRVVTRGDVAGRAFMAYWLAGAEVVAGMHVNLWDEGIDGVRELITTRRRVSDAELAESTVA